MLNKKLLFLFIFSFGAYFTQAQKLVFSDKPEEFIVSVKDMLQKTQRENVISTANTFSSIWEGGTINASQKTKIIEISKKLINKKATAAGEYNAFYAAIGNALNVQKISPAQLSEFLDVSEKVADKKALRDIKFFFDRSNNFFLLKTLFGNPYSRLYAFKGTYKFEYLEKPDEALQKELSSSATSDSLQAQAREITGPIVRYSGIDLIFASKFDSTGVKGTSGVFLITQNVFVGKGGRFDWKTLDLDPNQVYCEMDSYTMDVSKPVLLAKNATLTYTLLLSKNIKGDFEFNTRPRKDVYSALYPKFTSSENTVEIAQLGKNMSYVGGFTLEGRKIIGAARNVNQLSTIFGKNLEGENAFRAISRKFIIADSTISSPNTRFSLYLGASDSLYHANLQFKYLRGKHEINLVRDRNSEAVQTPFVNNHHEFYIEADVIKYNVDKDSMDIYMLSGAESLRPATFESFDYFNKDRFYSMIGVYDFHPLKLLTTYGQKVGMQSFYVQDLAKDYKRNEGVLRNVSLDLRSKGYIDYDTESGLITLAKRINQSDSSDLFLNAVTKVDAKTAKKNDFVLYDNFDHDNFRIESLVSSKPNASLKRGGNNELVIRGIKRFPMSEVLNVYIIPDSSKQSVSVYGGRNIYMEKGEITVGNFRFQGQQFFLLYDDFSLEMPIIDKILFRVIDSTSKQKESYEYGGEIRFGAGNMVISDHLNKSGRKKGKIRGSDESYESFPKLNIPQGGVVYFYNEFRQNFAYDSTKAKFILDEVDMDSLTTKVPVFPGKFVSTIFSEFNERLIPMQAPDLTMGFIHKQPKTSYVLYPENEVVKNAKMKFSRDLVMNKDGLFSGGEITYLTTLLKAPEFVFMPDSTTSDNIEFTVGAGKVNDSEFAEAFGKTAQLRWLVNDDRMLLTNKEEIIRLENSRNTLAQGAFEQRYKEKLITLYGSTNPMTLRGDLAVTADGLKGEGNLVRKDFTILSVSEVPFRFGLNKFAGNNVEFRINSKDRDPYEFDRGFFYTNNKAVLLGNFVDFDFDLAGGSSNIKPDAEFADFASLTLPYAEYKTSIKEALWDLKKKNITMKGDSTSRFTATIFGSEDFNEENLTFNASDALYDIPNLTLNVSGIPYINTADASVVPKDGKAVILKDAEMQDLKESKVLIDTLYRYHRLFNGNIKIKSRLDFEGDATYQFVNVQKDTFNVKFDKFELVEDEEFKKEKKRKGVKPPRYTYAKGTVNEEDKFFITSRVLFKGLIEMYANRRNLSLTGFIKLDLSSRSDYNNWIPYKSDKGDSVVLNIPEKLKIDNDLVTSGLHFTTGSNDLYTTFLSPKTSQDDIDVLLASGKLEYNPAINEFKVAPEAKTNGTSYTGNRLIFDDSKGSYYVEGKLHLLDANASKMVQVAGSGRVNKSDSIAYKFDTYLTFELPIPFKAVLPMQQAIRAKLPEKSLVITKNDPVVYKIAEIIGDEAFKKYLENVKIKPTPIYEAGAGLKRTLVFSKVEMRYSEEYKTFYSVGALRLQNIVDKVFDADVTGFVEFHKNSLGDNFTIYLQIDPDLWYYFEFEEGVFRAISSDENFNAQFESKTAEPASLDKKEAFISKFRELYNAAELPRKEEEENPDEEKTDETKKDEVKPDEEKKDEVKKEDELKTDEEKTDESKKEDEIKTEEEKKDDKKKETKKDPKKEADKVSKDDKKKKDEKKKDKKEEEKEGF